MEGIPHLLQFDSYKEGPAECMTVQCVYSVKVCAVGRGLQGHEASRESKAMCLCVQVSALQAEEASPALFAALARVRIIHDNCRALMRERNLGSCASSMTTAAHSCVSHNMNDQSIQMALCTLVTHVHA